MKKYVFFSIVGENERGTLVQGKKEPGSKLFYDIRLDDLVPEDHMVRRIDEVLDLDFLYKETRDYYSHEGKPSIDPVVLFKIYILGYFFGIRSERQLFREIQVNLAYRWFIGYDLDEDIPHHSISRYRFSKEVFERLFIRIVDICKKSGLISGDYYFIDSTMVRADVSAQSFKLKLRTESDYLQELEEQQEQKRSYAFDGTVDTSKMGRRRERVKKSDRFESVTDKDAEMYTRPGAGIFPAYKAHICVDPKNQVILCINGSRASEDDMSQVHNLFCKSRFLIGKNPQGIIADSKYGGIEGLKYFLDQGIDTYIPPRTSNSNPGKFRNNDFEVIERGKSTKCPAGYLSKKVVKHRYRFQYRWDSEICNQCELKSRCTASMNGRMVSFYRGEYYQKAQQLLSSHTGKRLFRKRQTVVEGVIGEAKNFHLMRRSKYRRLDKLKIQLLLTATVINVKRLVRKGMDDIKNPVKQQLQCINLFFFKLFYCII